MSKAINKITARVLYYPDPASRSEQAFSGYLKASITDVVNVEAERRVVVNSYFPVIFVPFTMRREEKRGQYTLAERLAFEAKDISPAHLDVKKRKWEFSYLTPPQREQGRLQAILSTLQQNLEEMTELARPLKNVLKNQRKRLLSLFPLPLREGIAERTFYGTLAKKPLPFFVYEHQLPSYKGEDKIPGGVLPKGLRPQLYLIHTLRFYG